ncbi:polysaccharide biosynthesis/export family protein [Citreimonas salinaria]|uniref:Polysaccharide export outer membrane protein n=1 Tax=Citreimonas salinaria TaxID=321339 RepID=A0A1H3F9H9_9RHOB|nr:polysaccharide biosynthesis/export family protein [Citreimonas salinaria]SDX87545.1 polysaccharide export outer membrane protein [Citreimonas salinaria]
MIKAGKDSLLPGNAPRAVALAMALAVSGCGITYKSPSVRTVAEGAVVDVVPLTPAEVARANRTPYAPKSLPNAFFVGADLGQSEMSGAALPAMPYVPEEQREALDLRPLPSIDPPPYRIGVGDVVLLATRGAASTVEQLSGLLAAQSQRQGYTVRDDGTIAIPEVGTIDIGGLTLQQAEDRVFETLVSNQIDPSFSLEVAEFNSKRATVGGAVGQTTIVPIGLSTVTLRDALTAAGGLTVTDEEFASVRIYRDGTLYQIPVEVLLDEPSLGNAALLDGDAIYVDTSYDLTRALQFYQSRLDVIARREATQSAALTRLQAEIARRRAALDEQRSLFRARTDLDAVEREYVYLVGEVNNQSRFALPYGHTASLADVLYDQGGFSTETGDPSQIYVLRDGAYEGRIERIIAYHLDASNVVHMMNATEFEMRPRDIVFIEEQPITKWNRALQQFFPVLIREATATN